MKKMENFLRMMAIAICLVVVDNAMMAMTTMTTIDEDGYYFVNDFESNVPLTRTVNHGDGVFDTFLLELYLLK